MAKNILLVRHGEPEAGYTKRFLGRLDPGLSESGIAQAQRLAERVQSLRPTRCVASPLRRASDTAKILAKASGLEVEHDDRLLEISYGKLEGLTFPEAAAVYPEAADSWLALAGDFAFPGGEDFPAFDRRAADMARFVSRIPEETVLLVAHGGILRGVLCHLLGLPANGRLRFRFAYASLATVELSAMGGGALTGFNVGMNHQ